VVQSISSSLAEARLCRHLCEELPARCVALVEEADRHEDRRIQSSSGMKDHEKRLLGMDCVNGSYSVNSYPPSPMRLNGASEFRLLSEHKGYSTKVESKRITLERLLMMEGRLKV
jgi:hypothetical protein